LLCERGLVKRLNRGSDLSLNRFDDARVGQGAEITQLVTLSGRDLAQDAAHNLTGSSLGEVGNEDDFLWGGEWPDDLPDLKDELLDEGSFIVRIVGEFTGGRGVGEFRSLKTWPRDTYGLRVTKA
jgi:hypothetical protein